MIAALFVATGGAYYGLPDVDPWPESRDARLYDGPYPVVAHPPCARWCRLAGLVEKRWGHKRGEDGGCFASALANVRRVGGVLEHPAYSDAWAAFGLPVPPRHGGWVKGFCGGWTAHVEQWRYGHQAKKATWLYAHGTELPALRWGSVHDSATAEGGGAAGARLKVRQSHEGWRRETKIETESRGCHAARVSRRAACHGAVSRGGAMTWLGPSGHCDAAVKVALARHALLLFRRRR